MATPETAIDHTLPAGLERTLVVVTMLMMSLMAAVDMTIVTVALPYMAGGLSATADDITWVVTMYTVSQAVAVGISGHLSRWLGRKRLCVLAVAGFVGSSILCALAQNLGQIVVFRSIQGFFGGPLIPVAQSILVDTFPPKERVKGLTFWVLGVMIGPAAGPARDTSPARPRPTGIGGARGRVASLDRLWKPNFATADGAPRALRFRSSELDRDRTAARPRRRSACRDERG